MSYVMSSTYVCFCSAKQSVFIKFFCWKREWIWWTLHKTSIGITILTIINMHKYMFFSITKWHVFFFFILLKAFRFFHLTVLDYNDVLKTGRYIQLNLQLITFRETEMPLNFRLFGACPTLSGLKWAYFQMTATPSHAVYTQRTELPDCHCWVSSLFLGEWGCTETVFSVMLGLG